VTSTGSAQRKRVEQLLRTDPDAALQLARRIADGWFRCQALAFVAHLQERGRPALLKEAFAAADALTDVNRRVTAASWPLKVSCRSEPRALPARLGSLLELARTEKSPVRRADALNYVLGAVVSAPRPLFRQGLAALLEACRSPLASGKPNSRGQAHIEQWAVITHALEPALSLELLALLEGPTLPVRARARIERLREETPEQLCSWPELPRP
jgi:hypothetical protein